MIIYKSYRREIGTGSSPSGTRYGSFIGNHVLLNLCAILLFYSYWASTNQSYWLRITKLVIVQNDQNCKKMSIKRLSSQIGQIVQRSTTQLQAVYRLGPMNNPSDRFEYPKFRTSEDIKSSSDFLHQKKSGERRNSVFNLNAKRIGVFRF